MFLESFSQARGKGPYLKKPVQNSESDEIGGSRVLSEGESLIDQEFVLEFEILLRNIDVFALTETRHKDEKIELKGLQLCWNQKDRRVRRTSHSFEKGLEALLCLLNILCRA